MYRHLKSITYFLTLFLSACNSDPNSRTVPTELHNAPWVPITDPSPRDCGPTTEPETRHADEIVLNVENDFTNALVWSPSAGVASRKTGFLFVSGVDGGYLEPVDGIYTRIAE